MGKTLILALEFVPSSSESRCIVDCTLFLNRINHCLANVNVKNSWLVYKLLYAILTLARLQQSSIDLRVIDLVSFEILMVLPEW